jgi:hypothetical protein
MRTDNNPKGFNEATLQVIDLLSGDRRTGKCFCPCHDDGENPSLQVGSGDKVPVIIHCFGRNSRDHNQEVVEYLRANGVWPTSDTFARERSSERVEQARSPEDRRLDATKMWRGLRDNGELFRPLLAPYLNGRGIKEIPTTALAVLPREFLACADEWPVVSHDPGMVLPVSDEKGKFQGLHVIWLNADMTAKREAEPQRQSYGLIKGNFIQLTEINWDNPPPKLIIAEGPETALAMMQLTDLPAIATGGRSFFADVDPPRCAEYIIAVDCDEDGGSRTGTGELAQRLVGAVVRIAMPEKPEGRKDGYDWNDALIDAGSDKSKRAELARSIIEAPPFEAVMTEAA